MKKLIAYIKVGIVVLLGCVSVLLLLCESDSVSGKFFCVCISLLVAFFTYALYAYWRSKGDIPDLTDIRPE